MTVVTHSPAETQAFAHKLGQQLKPGTCIAFAGGLGAGKTTFTRGLALGMGLPDTVSSPTFALVNEYRGDSFSVFHFDMYRIEDEDELYSIGFYDYADRGGICITEWSENIEYALPERYIRVELTKNSETDTDSRAVVIEIIGD